MKKYLLLLLFVTAFASAQVNPTKFEKVRITSNTTSTTATKVNVQEADGTVNTITKSDLIEYLEYASAVNLPVTGLEGKIYLTRDNNTLYRWNGTIYTPITADLSGKENISNKQNSLASDGTNTKYPTVTAVNTGLGLKENSVNKNTANGYAGLGSDGKLISSQLPSITISDTFVVGSQSAMLAVTAETGDVAVRTDLNKSFILKGTNSTVLADWQELLTPTSAVTTVFGRNGAVTAQTGDYNADQITETATRVFQTPTQRINNDATSSIQTQLNSKESAFSKNTAFNKNFGTSSGTVAEGNDSRILNGQTAFGWGNHSGLYPSLTGTGANGTWGINISGISGNSNLWGGYSNAFGVGVVNIGGGVTVNSIPFYSSSDVVYRGSNSLISSFLGLGSNAYTSTAYLPLSGNSTVNGIITTNGFKLGGTDQISWGGGFNSGKPLIEGSVAGLNIYPKGNLNDGILNVVGSATFSSSVTASQFFKPFSTQGSIEAPLYEPLAIYGLGTSNLAGIYGGNSFGNDNGTFLKLRVNSNAIASTPIDALTIDSQGRATFASSVTATKSIKNIGDNLTVNGLIGTYGFGPIGYEDVTSEISANFEGPNWYNGSNLIFKTSQSADITYYPSLERMRISANGNVGIGTTSPAFYTNYTSLTIGDNNAARTGLLKLKSTYNSGDGFELSQLSTGDVYFGLNSITPLQVIKANGNLLIGTTTDDGVNKLQVNGAISATSFNGSATLTGTPTAPTASAGTNTNQIATTAFVQANARPYKVYTALLNQSGTSAPTATVLENTLGGTVVWSYSATGVYVATLSGAFTSSKTAIQLQNTSNTGVVSTFTGTSNFVSIATYDSIGTSANGKLTAAFFEIRVYN